MPEDHLPGNNIHTIHMASDAAPKPLHPLLQKLVTHSVAEHQPTLEERHADLWCAVRESEIEVQRSRAELGIAKAEERAARTEARLLAA